MSTVSAQNLSTFPANSFPVERLPALSADEASTSEVELESPRWLRQLELPHARQSVKCLPQRTVVVKRVLDIAVALTLMFATAPILLAAIVLIRLTSKGPAFFTQFRAGLFGKPFRIYKLRTMYVDADDGGPRQAQNGDSRITPIGKFLRQTRIDELPQLFNVLRGDMTMVGPRPECIEYIDELAAKVPAYPKRLGLKPGLTGVAQIEGGYANDLESYRRKVAYDLLYLQNCCIVNDVTIMGRTVKVVLTGFGAL